MWHYSYSKFRHLPPLLIPALGGILAGGASCAGPHTPLGAVWTVSSSEALEERQLHLESRQLPSSANPSLLNTAPEIHLNPESQVLHGPSPLRVTVRDPGGDLDQFRFTVRYDGFDVTRSFLRQCRVSQRWSERAIVYENPVLRLPADNEHVIDFSYRSATGDVARVRYQSPICYAFRPGEVANTGDFTPSRAILSAIEGVSRREGFNPAFFTGLVAQESRFVPTAVSRAKAIGLTQVTSLAEQEIVERYPDWPRYPEIDRMSAEKLRILIMSGRMNASNEWRLEPKHSIQGGALYARRLAERWSSSENLRRLKELFAEPEIEHAKLILASYHSGYSRVSAALGNHGKDWLKASDLQEARKYVNKIFSYCHFFERKKTGGREDQNA